MLQSIYMNVGASKETPPASNKSNLKANKSKAKIVKKVSHLEFSEDREDCEDEKKSLKMELTEYLGTDNKLSKATIAVRGRAPSQISC